MLGHFFFEWGCKKFGGFPNLLSMLAGFSGLVVEGDNANVMRAISSPTPNFSLLGNSG